MPVIDETVHTREIKEFKKEVLAHIEEMKKRIAALEAQPTKGK